MNPPLAALVGAAIAAYLTAGAAAQPAQAPNSLGPDWRLQQNEVRQGVTERRLKPLGQVIEHLRRHMGGRLLDSGLEYRSGQPIYRIRWMTRDGRRVDLLVDAATGRVLSGG